MAAAAISPKMISDIRQNADLKAKKIRHTFEIMCRDAGVKYKTVHMKGDARACILKAISDLNIDVVIIASRGHGTLKRCVCFCVVVSNKILY